MIALVLMAAFAVYLIISILVVIGVAALAKKRGRSPFRWGIVAALAMYHLVFWDFIPTYVVYKYYCNTKAGFWVYKTPEQWKAENPGVAETLTWRDRSRKYSAPGVAHGYYLNERIIWIRKKAKKNNLLTAGYTERLLVDVKNNEVLVKQIYIWAGDSGPIKRPWMDFPVFNSNFDKFDAYKSKFKILGRKAE